MIEPTVIRFEATDIDPELSDDLALLVMETALNERVAIEMRRPVFDALYERMQQALDDEASRVPPRSDA